MLIANGITPPWTRFFAEIALRALLRVHHDYLLWSLPQKWRREYDASLLTCSPGAAFADEPSVCAAIVQEFMASRFVSGGWIAGSPSKRIKRGRRYYRIVREALYPDGLSDERADLRLERIDPAIDKPTGRSTFLEAKRAFQWTTHLIDRRIVVKSLRNGVRSDVEKVRTHLVASNGKLGRGRH